MYYSCSCGDETQWAASRIPKTSKTAGRKRDDDDEQHNQATRLREGGQQMLRAEVNSVKSHLSNELVRV